MKKEYRAATHVCLNVVLRGGKNKHVSFVPLSGGGSVYTTDDAETQQALERHYKYGRLFRVVDIAPASEPVAEENPPGETEEKQLQSVQVSDYDAAKDYLADHFGLTRTSLRSQRAIEAAAAQHGVKFVFP